MMLLPWRDSDADCAATH